MFPILTPEQTKIADKNAIESYGIPAIVLMENAARSSAKLIQKIINENAEVRNDLQSYSRLLHLMAHYELGNYDLMEYLTKSVYRFMSKKDNLTVVEEEMFKFLRKSFHVDRSKVRAELEQFLEKIKGLEKNRFETRVFAYLDIISWVESKVYRKSMSEILQEKYKERKKRIYK